MALSFHEFVPQDNKGKALPFSTLKGKAVLIVNTASKCGFTPQYEGLQALHEKYGPRGLVVLGFPCDQFAHQEPGSDEEIASFCSVNFGVSFPLMKKIEVNGSGQHPLYAWLKANSGGFLAKLSGTDIKWNFTKFLVDPEGKKVRRFGPATKPEALEPHIQRTLGLEIPR